MRCFTFYVLLSLALSPKAGLAASKDLYGLQVQYVSGEKTFNVIFSGRTKIGTQVNLGDEIQVFEGHTLKRMPTSRLVNGSPRTTADDSGRFSFKMLLPVGLIQVPFRLKHPEVREPDITVSFRVTASSAELPDTPGAEAENAKIVLSAGLGFNYFKYSQTVSELNSDVDFESFRAPAWHVSGERRLNPRWSVLASITSASGHVSSSDTIEVRNGTFSWLTATVEGLYLPEARLNVIGFISTVGGRAGVQYHRVPFLIPLSAGLAEMSSNSLTLLTAGPEAKTVLNKNWSMTLFLRYQYPLASGPRFSIQPLFAFDGSVGAERELNERWQLGAFWYGQWHKYGFVQKASGSPGRQELFYSNLELRLSRQF